MFQYYKFSSFSLSYDITFYWHKFPNTNFYTDNSSKAQLNILQSILTNEITRELTFVPLFYERHTKGERSILIIISIVTPITSIYLYLLSNINRSLSSFLIGPRIRFLKNQNSFTLQISNSSFNQDSRIVEISKSWNFNENSFVAEVSKNSSFNENSFVPEISKNSNFWMKFYSFCEYF